MPQLEVPFVTATDLYGTKNHSASVVGMAMDRHFSGFWILGENTDPQDGDCGFHWASFTSGEQGQTPHIWVEAGGTVGREFGPSGTADSWHTAEVTFRDPFLTPPTVLLSAVCQRSDRYHGVPALGIARAVSTHGFTLAARNTSSGRGLAAFSWVALGCSQFCAWGPKS